MLHIELMDDRGTGTKNYELTGDITRESLEDTLDHLYRESGYVPATLSIPPVDHDRVRDEAMSKETPQPASQCGFRCMVHNEANEWVIDDAHNKVYGYVLVNTYEYDDGKLPDQTIGHYKHELSGNWISVYRMDGIKSSEFVWLFEKPQR